MKRKILIISGICAAVWILIISMVVLLLAAVASSVSEEFVTDYQRAAELINGSWQAILAFDTVRYDNDLDDADPNLSAMEFMIIDYKKYRWKHGSGTGANRKPGRWILVSSGTLNTAEAIREFFSLNEDDGVQETIKAMEKYRQPKPYSFQISAKSVEDVMDEFDFDDAKREWMGLLITDGILNEQFGIEIPDFMESVGSGYLPWPLPGIPESNMTSSYGMRVHPVTGVQTFHYGTDIGCAEGSPCIAIGDGTVIATGSGAFSGNYVQIRFKYDEYTWTVTYMHLSRINCSSGDLVKIGDVIGLSGQTGRVTGPHLHIEILCNGNYKNPAGLISGHTKEQ
mgnify:FL=1